MSPGWPTGIIGKAFQCDIVLEGLKRSLTKPLIRMESNSAVCACAHLLEQLPWKWCLHCQCTSLMGKVRKAHVSAESLYLSPDERERGDCRWSLGPLPLCTRWAPVILDVVCFGRGYLDALPVVPGCREKREERAQQHTRSR